ncbi:MAG: cell division protein FtsQ/DivIB [Acidimicrobiia bacterium]
MKTMEPRVAERRKGVSEDRARRRLRWVLIVLAVVLMCAAGVWLSRSSLLSISSVEVTGNSTTDPAGYVEALSMGHGTPTMDVDAGAIERAVVADPWIADAQVSLVWPGSIVIDVVEHTPVAVVQSGPSWVLAAADGSILEPAEQPNATDPAVAVDIGALGPGDVSEDPMVIGALVLIDSLAPELATGVVVFVDDGGLHATVEGHRVRFGRPVDMAQKAAVLEALIASGLDPGVAIDVIAPLRPAVALPVDNSQAEVEGEE